MFIFKAAYIAKMLLLYIKTCYFAENYLGTESVGFSVIHMYPINSSKCRLDTIIKNLFLYNAN